MRVNVYSQELTGEVSLVTTRADDGRLYHGLRFVVAGSDCLHFRPLTDNRAAVTFWFPDRDTRVWVQFHAALTEALRLLTHVNPPE